MPKYDISQHVGGKWSPGQSGNPKGRPPIKPFKDAMARLRERKPEVDDEIALALAAKAMNGDVAAAKEWADRSDGKIPQAIGGSDELGPIATTHIVRTIVDTKPADSESLSSST